MSRSSRGARPSLGPGGRILVPLWFFLSGATSLVFQVAWSKMFAVQLGSTLWAITTVVAAFMCGLGLGSLVGARLADRLAYRVKLYGLVEGIVGLFGLASPFLFPALDPILRLLYDPDAPGLSPLLAARFSLLFLVLMIPTLAMGATLPLLVAFLTGHDSRFGRHVGRLYAINTLGAVSGTWTAGFVLIPNLGLSATAYVAGAVNLVILATVFLARLPEPPVRVSADDQREKRPAKAETESPAPTVSPLAASGVLVVLAFSGALALSYEIAWTRSLSIVIGSSTYSFSVILGTYLLGIAAGSWAVSRFLLSVRRPFLLLASLQVFLGLAVMAGTFIIPRLGQDFARLLLAWSDPTGGVGMGVLFLASVLVASAVVLVPSLILGAIFPTAVDIVHRARRRPGASVGRAYALNTVGTIFGSVITGFVLLETLGVQKTLLWGAAGSLALGAALMAAAEARTWRFGAVALLLLMGPAAALGLPAWDPGRTNAGLSRIVRGVLTSASHRISLDQLPLTDVVFAEQGRLASVIISKSHGQTTLWVSGKPDASSLSDMETQVLSGHLPILLARNPREVAVIGLGSGVTTGSVLTHPVELVETLEIEPAVIRASRFFEDVNGRPLEDPRHRIIPEDGRTWLEYSGRSYDVIISEPSNPWISGIGNLFTRDFYLTVRERLNPGGVFCQWFQLYESSPETTWSIARGLVEVFDRIDVFVTNRNSDTLLMARVGEEPIEYGNLRELLARPEVAEDLARIGIRDPFDLALYHRGTLSEFLPREPGPVNTDENAFVEFQAPRDLMRRAPFHPFPIDGREPDRAAEALFSDLPRGEALAGIGQAFVRRGLMNPAQALEARMTEENYPQVDDLRETLMEAVGLPLTLRPAFGILREAGLASARGDHLAAVRLFDQARAAVPDEPWLEFRRAQALVTLGTSEVPDRERYLREAWTVFNGALERDPPDDDYPALVNMGIIQCSMGKFRFGLTLFEEARKLDPERGDAYWYAGRALRDVGDRDWARETFILGYGKDPGHPGLRAEVEASVAAAQRPAAGAILR